MKRYVVISDLQAPYHCRPATKAVTAFLKEYQPDSLLCVGDEADSPEVSRWKKGLAGEYSGTLQRGLDETREILRGFREAIGDGVPFTIHRSNHTDRIKTYVERYAPGLTGLRALDYATLVGYDELDIDFNPRPKEIAPGWVMVHGDESGSSRTAGGTALGIARKIGKSVVAGHCFDDETEILTDQGWRKHTDLEPGTIVATSSASRAIEFQPVQNVHRYDTYDTLMSAGSRYVSLAVTPDHGLVVIDDEDETRLVKASEVFKTDVSMLVSASNSVDREDSLALSDTAIDFLAFVAAFGIIYDETKLYFPIPRMSPTNKNNVLHVESLLSAGGFSYEKSPHFNLKDLLIVKVTDDAALEMISTFFDYNLQPTSAMRSLSLESQKRFLHAYASHRGYDNADEDQVLFSREKPLMDYLQEVAFLSGFRSRLDQDGLMWNLTLDSPRNDRDKVPARAWREVPYDGIVWCVTVPNGTVVVRRRGRVVITQNTHSLGLQHDHSYMNGKLTRRLYGVEVGHLMDLKKAEYLKLGAANWQMGFGMLYVYKDKVYPQVVPIVGKSFVVEGQRYAW